MRAASSARGAAVAASKKGEGRKGFPEAALARVVTTRPYRVPGSRGTEGNSSRAWESPDGVAFVVEPAIVRLEGIETVPERVHHVYDPRLTRIRDTAYALVAMDLDRDCRLGLARSRGKSPSAPQRAVAELVTEVVESEAPKHAHLHYTDSDEIPESPTRNRARSR